MPIRRIHQFVSISCISGVVDSSSWAKTNWRIDDNSNNKIANKFIVRLKWICVYFFRFVSLNFADLYLHKKRVSSLFPLLP